MDDFKLTCEISSVIVEHAEPLRQHWVRVGELTLRTPMRLRILHMAIRLLVSQRLNMEEA